MDLFDYKTGSVLRLEIYDDLGDRIEHDFVSQHEETINEYEAVIAVPIVEGVVYAVRVGWSITVYRQEGNTIYRFRANVMQRMQMDGLPMMRIYRMSEIDTAQRRMYYRFSCSIPFKYRIIVNYEKDKDLPFLAGNTADISGAGMGFISKKAFKVGDIIECELTIDDTPMYLVGKITRTTRLSNEDPDRMDYQVGVHFDDMDEQKRDLIIKYIFTEERRLIRMRIA